MDDVCGVNSETGTRCTYVYIVSDIERIDRAHVRDTASSYEVLCKFVIVLVKSKRRKQGN